MNVFGDSLRRAREAAGLTQDQVAERLGMSRTYYNRIENGGSVGDPLCKKIASLKELGFEYPQLRALRILNRLHPDEYQYALPQLERIQKEHEALLQANSKVHGLIGPC